jgi:RecJ-like exonuclease
MNREERARARKILHLDAAVEDTPDDACILCAFVKVQVIGRREHLYKDLKGGQIDLPIAQRMEPPYGLRWPYDLNNRPPCSFCKGKGRLEVINLQKKSKDIRACGECYGLGKQLKGDEFAPLCEPCARYVLGWIGLRGNEHMQKQGGGKLMIANEAMLNQMLAQRMVQQQAPPDVGQFVLPRMK